MNQNSGYKKIYKDAQFIVETQFKQHKITKISTSYREFWYKIKNPKTYSFSFNLIFNDDGIIVYYGDLGNFILKVSDNNPLGWLVSTLYDRQQISVDYIVSKIVAGDYKEWYEEDLKEYLEQNKNLACDDPEKLPDEILEYQYVDYSREEFGEVIYNWNFEACNMFEKPNFAVLLAIFAMKWFVHNIEEPDENTDTELIVE